MNIVNHIKRAAAGYATLLSLVILAGTGTASALSSNGSHASGHWNQKPTVQYVALGDSVSSGLGLGSAPPSSNFEDTLCGRSSAAYPHEVTRLLNEKADEFGVQVNLTNLSCQGATTQHLKSPQLFNGIEVAPQVDRAFAQGTPLLITMTMGANDTKWSELIANCFGATNCDTSENTEIVEKRIADMQARLTTALEEVESRGGDMPPLFVATGYYQPVSAQCVNANLTMAEVQWLDRAHARLNQAIQDTTEGSYMFSRFAPVDFTGHDICSADPWVQRPGEPASFHPTATGQSVIAKAVFEQLGPQVQ